MKPIRPVRIVRVKTLRIHGSSLLSFSRFSIQSLADFSELTGRLLAYSPVDLGKRCFWKSPVFPFMFGFEVGEWGQSVRMDGPGKFGVSVALVQLFHQAIGRFTVSHVGGV